MQSKLLQDGPQKTYAVVLNKGEDPTVCLQEFASREGLNASQFTAIGAFSHVTLGYFDWSTKEYEKIYINEQVEVLSLIGDITLEHDMPNVHAHVVVGKRDGTAHGGHLLEASVRPTLEIILTESPRHLEKKMDEETGLALISIQE